MTPTGKRHSVEGRSPRSKESSRRRRAVPRAGESFPEAHSSLGVPLYHPVAFWLGVSGLIAGVLMHLPDFLSMADMGYRMADMPMSAIMLTGMALILVGLPLSAYGLLPRFSRLLAHREAPHTRYDVKAMDDAPLTSAHWWLLWVLGVALVVDVMKPATLGFVVPGMRSEYAISTQQISALPVFALAGTTLGSILWGMMADRLGRRATILLASLFFMATSICGFMPALGWQLLMCFIMGLSAGGMLPIVYALMAESMPARVRSWLIILHGGLATVCGYLAASGLAALFEPQYTWRILWFFNLPTGFLILLMNRWIPESPRFLLENGRPRAAQAVLDRFGIRLEVHRAETGRAASAGGHPPTATPETRRRIGALFRQPFLRHSATVVCYGIGWGLVNWGFITFLPTMLRDSGLAAERASGLLFWSSLAAIPGTILVAFLYGKWSSKKTMLLFALITVAVLMAIAALGGDFRRMDPTVLGTLVMALMVSSTAMITMLSPYSAEVFPTGLRGTGSGVAAASSKAGGILGPPLMGFLLGGAAGISTAALAAACPIGIAALVLLFNGVETRGRGLEQVSDAAVP